MEGPISTQRWKQKPVVKQSQNFEDTFYNGERILIVGRRKVFVVRETEREMTIIKSEVADQAGITIPEKKKRKRKALRRNRLPSSFCESLFLDLVNFLYGSYHNL